MPAATGGQPAGGRVGKMQKSMRKRRGKHIGCFNKKQNASRTKLMQRPIHPDITFEDGFGNLVKSCQSSSSERTKQIESELSESFVSLASFVDGTHVINSFEEEFEDNTWSTLSENVALTMSECVVSLASFNGNSRCFACTGVYINCNPVRILTTASLVKTSGDGNKIDDNLRIEVHLNNKQHVTGTLKHYDLRYNVAVVEIMGSYSSCAVDVEERISFTPNIEVLAVGRLFERPKLMASRGVLIDRESKLACEELGISTCKITKAGIGGPLIDACGNLIGMNFFHDEETPYLPREKIQEVLGYFDEQCMSNDSWSEPRDRYYIPAFYSIPYGLFGDEYFDNKKDAYSPSPVLC
ncbi:uncharacterized protein LOC119294144 [Triticum dicoccoides]|nr:uncharacterized protein LOC119294144 [Triticum dicoccoides]